MPDTAIMDAPAGVQIPDKPQEPLKVKVGDKFRAALAAVETTDAPPKEEPKTETAPTEPPKEPPKEVPPTAPAIEKPTSPLDAVLAGEPKPSEKTEEPDVLKDFDEKTANWSKAREVMKTQSGELRTLREEVKALKAAPKVEPSVVESLTKERDELNTRFQQQEERLKAINAEYSEPFQKLVAAKDKDVAKLAGRAKSLGVDADALIGAVSLPEGKVRTEQIKLAMAELDPDDKVTIRALIEKIEGHDEAIADFRKDLPGQWDKLQAQRDAQLAEQTAAQLKTLETEYVKITDEIPSSTVTLREVPDDVPGAAEWNAEIKAARESALTALKPNGADFNKTVDIAFKGARYDSLEKRYLALHSEHIEAKKRLAEFDAGGPDFKGGKKPTTEIKKTAPQKFHEALARAQGAGVGEV